MSEWKKTEFGKIPASWKYEPLESFFSWITYGFTNPMPTTDDGPIMLTAKDIVNGKIQYSTARKTSWNAYDKLLTAKSKPILNDILITKDGSIGRVAIVDRKDLCISQSVALIRCNDNIIPLFLKYLLESPQYQNLIDRDADGSTIKHVYITRINKMLIGAPAKDEQKRILSVIETIQKKIDLLQRQNKNLEQQAALVLDKWFLEDSEASAEKQMQVGDLVESVSLTHKFPKKKVIFLNTSDIYLGDVLVDDYIDVKSLPGQAKKSIKKGDILFSEIRPANGRYAYIDFDGEEYVVSTKLMVLRSKGLMSQALVYFFLTHKLTIDWLQMLAESRSGTFPQITFDQIKELKMNIPAKEMLLLATDLCEMALHKIKSNNNQIRTLTQLRDTLLPKLMSGEVRVKI